MTFFAPGLSGSLLVATQMAAVTQLAEQAKLMESCDAQGVRAVSHPWRSRLEPGVRTHTLGG